MTMRAMNAPVEPDALVILRPRGPGASLGPDQHGNAQHPEEQGEKVGLASAEESGDRDIPGQSVRKTRRDVPKAVRERGNLLVAEHQKCSASEDQHPGQGDDEGRNTEVCDPIPLPGADYAADDEDEQYPEPDRQSELDDEDPRQRPGESDD